MLSRQWPMLPGHSGREARGAVSALTVSNPRGTELLDFSCAVLGLLVLSPVLLALAIAIKLTSPGPALFCSVRIGQNARPFTLYKFRSMVDGAQAIGPAITAAHDQRLTPVGAVIRRLKLDELPQLLNVLKGDMSLVGPRPEVPSYVALYSRDQLAVLDAKPGITSPASLEYRDEAEQLTGHDWENRYASQVMPAKLALDADYLSRRTVGSDILVILRTIGSLVRDRRGRAD